MASIDPRYLLEGGSLGLVGMVLVWFLYRIEGKPERFTKANEELARAVSRMVERERVSADDRG